MKTTWELILDVGLDSPNTEVITAGIYMPADGSEANASDEGVPDPTYSQAGDDFLCVLFPKSESSGDVAEQHGAEITHEALIPPGVSVPHTAELRASGGRVFRVLKSTIYDSGPGSVDLEQEQA